MKKFLIASAFVVASFPAFAQTVPGSDYADTQREEMSRLQTARGIGAGVQSATPTFAPLAYSDDARTTAAPNQQFPMAATAPTGGDVRIPGSETSRTYGNEAERESVRR